MQSKAHNEIFLIRHGETEANAKRILQGRKEFPLSVRGHWQCRMLSQRLKQEAVRFSALLSSRQVRAWQTAEIIAAELGMHAVKISGFEESRLGEIEGLSAEEVQINYPGIWETAQKTSWGYAAPGGESRRQLLSRVKPVFEKICRQAQELNAPVLIVTHASVIKAIVSDIKGLPMTEKCPYIFNNASISIIKSSAKEKEIMLLNDCRHLYSCKG